MNLPDSDTTEQAILAVLTGTPIAEAADRAQTSSAHLVAATERYREAGRAALEIRGASSGWLQANIEFADYSNAERIFLTHFLPPLWQAAQSGTIGGWWFVRKYPCWRLRAIPGPRSNTDRLSRETSQLLDLAASESGVERWWTSPYEPETTAFGGPEGMNIAHSLFHTDSLGALHYLHYVSEDGKRFLDAKATSLLLICLFLRAANQEWSEQGDVWARVEAARPLPDDVQVDRVTAMAPALHKLLTADAAPSLAASGPLAPVADWATGMERGGRLLGQAGQAGNSVSAHAASWPGMFSSTGTAWASPHASRPSGPERRGRPFSMSSRPTSGYPSASRAIDDASSPALPVAQSDGILPACTPLWFWRSHFA